MIKYTRKVIIFTIIGVLIFFMINAKYKITNTYKNRNYEIQKFKNVPNHIKIGNLGSSHGLYNITYEELKKTSFNFALPAQNFYYDYELLKKYIDNIDENAIIFIPISFPSYGDCDNKIFSPMDRRYINIVDKKDIKNISYSKDVLLNYFKIIGCRREILSIFKDEDIKKPEWLITDKNNYIDKIDIVSKSKYDNQIELLSFNIETISYLEKIISLLKSKKIIPILYTAPITKNLKDLYSINFLNKFYKINTEISKKFEVIYLDYSSDKRIVSDLDLFLDADHLNLKGRKKFSDILFEETNLKLKENLTNAF